MRCPPPPPGGICRFGHLQHRRNPSFCLRLALHPPLVFFLFPNNFPRPSPARPKGRKRQTAAGRTRGGGSAERAARSRASPLSGKPGQGKRLHAPAASLSPPRHGGGGEGPPSRRHRPSGRGAGAVLEERSSAARPGEGRSPQPPPQVAARRPPQQLPLPAAPLAHLGARRREGPHPAPPRRAAAGRRCRGRSGRRGRRPARAGSRRAALLRCSGRRRGAGRGAAGSGV